MLLKLIYDIREKTMNANNEKQLDSKKYVVNDGT